MPLKDRKCKKFTRSRDLLRLDEIPVGSHMKKLNAIFLHRVKIRTTHEIFF